MLKIGEFSRYARISIRMLRHYDAEGVLVPAEQDPATGYRLYDVEQLAEANRIKALRDLGFQVRDIKRLLALDAAALADELRQQQAALDAEAARVEERRAALGELLRAVEAGDVEQTFEVQMKRVPAYDVVTLRMELRDYDEERFAWERLGQLMHARGIAPSEPYTEFCTFPTGDVGDAASETVVVEVSVAASGEEAAVAGADDLRFHRSAELPQAASLMVYGPYERIAAAYASFARWLEAHPTLRAAGDVREIAHRGPWNAADPSDYLTELQIPVEPA
ncbi:MerR family transcriptional regulator [Eggerthella sinensis]|uniref:HTH merR-type domain-containing protein n=1 Tax=Eggerthella sinensis TaxID=242230 RepID=A0A3N0J182_9ACTN|nr:MerR family transcriptional regulator [Eggerthella sinensis]RDB68770.1 hypothetical protein C1876_08760 [Eggerthella sinensis]RNM42954.1 hypothetical protein DMP09_02485 [Eggerthella sinensis]